MNDSARFINPAPSMSTVNRWKGGPQSRSWLIPPVPHCGAGGRVTRLKALVMAKAPTTPAQIVVVYVER